MSSPSLTQQAQNLSPHTRAEQSPPSCGRESAVVALDLFAGSGWGVACSRMGVIEHGVEIMPEARATRDAVGFSTIFEDVWDGLIDEDLLTPWSGERRLLIASPPCFTAGAPVLTKRGVISIEEVCVGDMVLTHEGRWRQVTHTMSREAETVKIGYIHSTPDHPFYAADQLRKWNNDSRRYNWSVSEPRWVDAQDTHGKFLAIPHTTEPDTEVAPPLDWWLIGRWVADGWGRNDGSHRIQVDIAVGAGKEEEFEARAGECWRRGQTNTSATRYTLYGGPIDWLKEHFGHGSHGKTVPGWLLAQPEHVRREFFEGYMSGDGCVDGTGWAATTVSANLAVGLKLLAESLGLTTCLVRTDLPETTVIEGRTVNQSGFWRIQFRKNDGRYSRTDALHRWVKQRKRIEQGSTETVYDITVDEDHSFVCWGYVVHNCQSFSMAGKGAGRKALDDVIRLIDEQAHQLPADGLRLRAEELGLDDRTALVLSPLAYIYRHRPEYVAMEQVPTVLPVWRKYCEVLEELGYSARTEVLAAEQFGVPQTRKRAILVASLLHEAKLPTPTHSKYYSRTPAKLDDGVLPWISMAEALGWGMTERPYPTIATGTEGGGTDPAALGGSGARRTVYAERARGAWEDSGDPDNDGGTLRLTDQDAATIQTFPESLNPPPSRNGGEAGRPDWLREGRFEAVRLMGPGMIARHGDRPARDAHQPAFTVRASAGGREPGGFVLRERSESGDRPGWAFNRPATTIAGDPRCWPPGHKVNASDIQRLGEETAREKYGDRAGTHAVKLTEEEAAILQTFPTWPFERPAPTVVGTRRSEGGMLIGRQLADGTRRDVGGHQTSKGLQSGQLAGVRVSGEDGAQLQTFPSGFPFQGSKGKRFLQIGNAVPPVLALAVLSSLLREETDSHA